MEDLVVAVGDVRLEEKLVKEVVEVLVTAGLVAAKHLAANSNKYDREACGYLQCSCWGLAEEDFPDC